MENTYSSFAGVYDLFMDNVPYDQWVSYLKELLVEYGVSDGIVVDLGCGTGSVTERLSEAGYDMIGVDNAPDMLEIAVEKREQSGLDILYLLQDMRELDLFGTAKAMVSICDSVNYIIEPEELEQVFEKVRLFLDPGGVFIFDFNTVHKYRDVIGEQTIAENREDSSFIWDNYYDEEAKINEYDLTLFIAEKSNLPDHVENGITLECEVTPALFRKYQETHFQRGYELDEMKALLKDGGLVFVTAYDAFTKNPVSQDSERVYVVARRNA